MISGRTSLKSLPLLPSEHFYNGNETFWQKNQWLYLSIFDFFSKWVRGSQMNLKSPAVQPPLCSEQRKQKKTFCGSEFINFMTVHLFYPKMALNSLTSLTLEQNSDYFSLFFLFLSLSLSLSLCLCLCLSVCLSLSLSLSLTFISSTSSLTPS